MYSYNIPWNSLVPLLITSLNWPPEEWPYCAENWLARIENSCTASFGILARGPVTLLLLLSTPSIVKLLLRGRCPPTDGPVPAPMAPLEDTPDVYRARFRTPEPPLVVGRSANCCASNVLCTCAVVVSMVTDEPVTSTTVFDSPTCSVTFVVDCTFRLTFAPLISESLNPLAVTFRL